MPRYFFDLSDGTRDVDSVGTDLSDDEKASVEAIRFLGEVLKHEPLRLAEGTLRVDVHDETRVRRWTVAANVEKCDPS